MRIGIYGGSFNPVHKGHTSLAESLVQQGCVDEVWLLVSPLNPLKQEVSADIAAYEHRLKMAELACEGKAGLKVSDFENRLPVPSYMVSTLAELCKAYPEHEFVLVIGADNWESFPRWYNYQEIIDKYSILVYRRPGYNVDEDALPSSVRMVTTPLYDISSTQIRHSVLVGEMLTEWVDEKVASYIREKGLYLPLPLSDCFEEENGC